MTTEQNRDATDFEESLPSRCECGWAGFWEDVLVELPNGTIGADPSRTISDPPYYCPECRENLDARE